MICISIPLQYRANFLHSSKDFSPPKIKLFGLHDPPSAGTQTTFGGEISLSIRTDHLAPVSIQSPVICGRQPHGSVHQCSSAAVTADDKYWSRRVVLSWLESLSHRLLLFSLFFLMQPSKHHYVHSDLRQGCLGNKRIYVSISLRLNSHFIQNSTLPPRGITAVPISSHPKEKMVLPLSLLMRACSEPAAKIPLAQRDVYCFMFVVGNAIDEKILYLTHNRNMTQNYKQCFYFGKLWEIYSYSAKTHWEIKFRAFLTEQQYTTHPFTK